MRVVVPLFGISHADYFGFHDYLSTSTALVGANALVRCKEGQVFAARTVTLVRDGFSTTFSTFLLKSFDRGGVANVESSRMTDSFLDRKKKNFSHSLLRVSHLAVNHFRRAFLTLLASEC
jgi:hypothetical protein